MCELGQAHTHEGRLAVKLIALFAVLWWGGKTAAARICLRTGS
jgi:hypothetical protein